MHMFYEGVASFLKSNKSTYWSYGLACFELRDSCIVMLCMESVYGCYRAWLITVLVFIYAYKFT